ncbi:TlpA family protein disulfide reductase [Hellea balneolensis]|uniref:TlpA family protein disulfide reductase n=1 Tax=Hellea balneolensis TaxID=287478 RepID=UPI00138AFDFF|nr:thioredoxin domain-containing protein [Hellea balneolensis]
MKTPLLMTAFISVLALGACSQAEAPKPSADKMETMATKAMSTKTKAVLVYADWCGSCKVLDPKIQKVQEMGPMPGLEFVTLDYTAKDAEAFYAQAEAAGVSEAVKAYLDGTIKTGQLLLVDLDDQKVVGRVTKTLEPAEIVTALNDAVKAS